MTTALPAADSSHRRQLLLDRYVRYLFIISAFLIVETDKKSYNSPMLAGECWEL